MDCREISADWAAQRIKGLSLGAAIKNAFFPKAGKNANGEVIKTLIDSFRYPRRGPGMMWEAAAAQMQRRGGELLMGRRVTGCILDQGRACWRVVYKDADGKQDSIYADNVISSAPISELIKGLTPKPSERTLHAANSLKYRDFVTVALMLKDQHRFEDNWIYIHDPSVKVGRVQNYKSWSPEMVPDPSMTCYGLEYFCFEGDGLWESSDEALIQLAKNELAVIGLADPRDIVDGCVVRQKKAYPVYDDEYATHVDVIRDELKTRFPNLHLVGRNGMHKYNNQDHAMMTAMLCVENIMANRQIYDLWAVNQDAEYHEAGAAGEKSAGEFGARLVPRRHPAAPRGLTQAWSQK